MEQNPIQSLAQRLRANIQKVIVGKDEVVELMLCAMIARGHVLLEDVPGTGKTVLAKSLAASLECGFARIQFTPDLLPSDVTGMSVYNAGTGAFEFKKGPVFTNILLADEINRATPRTQSSLLECMEERQVTLDGVTRKLDSPFLVLATQNPVETQGTFPLPEAQLDRFLMKLSMGYPTESEAMDILGRFIQDNPLEDLAPCAARDEVISAQRAVSGAYVSEPVRRYMAAICQRTRQDERVRLGVSPRGMLQLLRASQALAMIRGRDFVTPEDVKALARPVLGHRIILRGLYGQDGGAHQVLDDVLMSVPAPTESPERG